MIGLRPGRIPGPLSVEEPENRISVTLSRYLRVEVAE